MEYPFKDLMPLDEVTARDGYYKDWAHIDAETFHQISELTKFIREKGDGADTREAIAQALERVYHDATQSDNANMEVSVARKHFKDLAARLDASDNDLRNINVNWINKNLGKLDQSFMSEEFLQQMAGNTPINAVPADGSLTTSKYSEKSITPVKLSGAREISGENLYHPSDIINGKYIKDSGIIVNGVDVSMATVYVSPNSIYSFWRKRDAWEPVHSGPLVLNKVDGNKEVIDASTLTKGVHLGYEYVVFKTDTDTVSVSFNTKLATWDSSDKTILVEGNIISNKKEIKKIFSSEITDTKARDAILNYDKQTELTTPINLYNQNYLIEGKYIHESGEIRETSNVSFSKIPIVGGRTYTLWRGTNTWSLGSAGPIVFSTVENVRTTINASDYISGTYNDFSYVTIVAPVDAIFIEFNTKLLALDATENAILVEGDSIDGVKEVSKIFGMNIKPKPYAGKKWVAFGDSLTEKNHRATLNYHDYVSDDLGITVINMGVSGSGYKQKDDSNSAFYQRVNNIPLDADVITIFGSFNDLSAGIPIGTPSDTGIETLGGSINTTLDNLNTRLPIVPVGIIAPTPWQSSKPWDETNNSTQYVQLLKDICKHRGIPYLDLYYSSGLRPWEVDYRPLMYSRDDGNGTHPDENGHKLFYPQVREFLKSLI